MPKAPPDRFVIVGTALAVIVALIAAFATTPSRSVVLGVAIGMSGVALALLINVLAKQDETSQRILTKLEDVSQLEAALATVEWLRPLVTQIASAIGVVEAESRLAPFRPSAKEELKQCVTNLDDIARGQLRARVGEGILEERTNLAVKSLHAVSIQQMDVPRWTSDLGEKYWEANLAAIDRGVKIYRVFVYREWSEEYRALVQKHANAEVHAWVVDTTRAKVPDELMIDMAVWDQQFTYQFELNSAGDPIHNLYSVNEVDVARRINQFELLKALGRRIQAETSTVASATDVVGEFGRHEPA